MKLSVFNCNDTKFILYLINFLRKYILQQTNIRKLNRLDIYLNSLNLCKSKILCRNIIQNAANNLVFKKFQGEIIITINNTKKFSNTNAKLYDLCKLINYGTFSVKGYPIFTEAFNYVSDNIEILYYNYKEGINF